MGTNTTPATRTPSIGVTGADVADLAEARGYAVTRSFLIPDGTDADTIDPDAAPMVVSIRLEDFEYTVTEIVDGTTVTGFRVESPWSDEDRTDPTLNGYDPDENVEIIPADQLARLINGIDADFRDCAVTTAYLLATLKAAGIDTTDWSCADTGGYTASIYGGTPTVDADGDPRYPVLIGPGIMSDGGEFVFAELAVGPDGDDETAVAVMNPAELVAAVKALTGGRS